MDYKKLLEKGIKDLPEIVVKKERFEIPKVKGHIQGNKTVITNYNQIVTTLHRNSQHFLKFLLKELATPGRLDGPRLILGRKISSTQINEKIKQYANTYVICVICGKPDTKIIKKEDKTYFKCAACGNQKQLKV